MIEHKPNLDIVTRAARCEICPHCPLHWGPDRKSPEHASVCELECDLFKQLPVIRRIAACTDPMLRSVPKATAEAIEKRAPKGQLRSSPLWRNRNRFIALFTRLFGR